MTDKKITDLTALTGVNLATGDQFQMVDVSDTTMDASGTNKKMSATELGIGLGPLIQPTVGEDRSVTSDVTMTSSGTDYDGATTSLVAGTYLLWGKISLVAGSSAVRTYTVKLWDGTTQYDNAEYIVPGTATAATITLNTFAKITLASTTTVKISARSSVGGDKIHATSFKGTALMWLKVA